MGKRGRGKGVGVRVHRDKTGLELGMKESYEEDLASRFGLQRRAGYGNVSGLSVRAEGSAAQPLSSEIITSVCRGEKGARGRFLAPLSFSGTLIFCLAHCPAGQSESGAAGAVMTLYTAILAMMICRLRLRCSFRRPDFSV